jgi:hypothetical protein
MNMAIASWDRERALLSFPWTSLYSTLSTGASGRCGGEWLAFSEEVDHQCVDYLTRGTVEECPMIGAAGDLELATVGPKEVSTFGILGIYSELDDGGRGSDRIVAKLYDSPTNDEVDIEQTAEFDDFLFRQAASHPLQAWFSGGMKGQASLSEIVLGLHDPLEFIAHSLIVNNTLFLIFWCF